MTQEEKELLLKDLCARLPYGVKVYNTTFKEPTIQTLYGKISSNEFLMEETYTNVSVNGNDFGPSNKRHYTGHIDFIKPYLRPMPPGMAGASIDWLNRNMFDYRDLIPMGLAIEVTADNNPYK